MISTFHTYIDETASEQVQRVLSSTMLSEGRVVREFEEQLANQLGLQRAVAVNSGTSALHLAMVMAGVGPGDEVVLPAQTFVASALVVTQQGAKPIFADIDYNTGNLDPESLKAKITGKTRAIMAVHWAGLPCDLQAIQHIANQHGLPVIEDAAHALGAAYQGRPIGQHSEYTCFSFQAIKHVTTGDGGALVCNTGELETEAKTRRWFGIDRAGSTPSFLGERQYNIDCQGFKYHLNDYSAALGIANLRNFSVRLEKLRIIAAYYREALKDVSGIKLWDCPSDRTSAHWLFGLHAERRDDFIRALAGRGVVASVVHQRIDRNSIFGGLDSSLEQQEVFDRTQVHIPLHSAIDQIAAETVVSAIRQGW